MRATIADLAKMKAEGRRIVMLTAYDHPSARLAERAGVRLLLVGDSLGMVVHGHASTLPVTLDDMVRHSAAVVRGSGEALVVGDLPFLTYANLPSAVEAARRLMGEAGVGAIKLEGAGDMVAVIAGLVARGVPVMGHLGFTPQSAHQIGVRVQAKAAADAARLIRDAEAIEAAGVFALVLELVPAPLAEAISKRLTIPVIGIGAGAGCDGQVQVWHDVLGLGDGKPPRHAKVFDDLGERIVAALSAYREEVEGGAFPTSANSAAIADDVLADALDQAGR